jgi:hypothetical protein
MIKCDACEENAAVCKVTLTDMEGCVIDTTYLCPECNTLTIAYKDGKAFATRTM